jgi:hypothetical protein
MASEEIQQGTSKGISKGDIVKVLEPEHGTKESSGWHRAMDDTPGRLGVVIEVSGRHALVVLCNGRRYWYLPLHLKKAKKWQQRKYTKRSLSSAS